jgi:hypothetical protein
MISNMKTTDNGSLTDVLPLMDYLLEHLENLKKRLSKSKSLLLPAVQYAWTKLNQYYNVTDKSSIYVTAVILDPRLKLNYLQHRWFHNKG